MSCIIVGCKSHSSRKENDAEIISFHRFPSDVDMRQIWINAIARNNWEWKKQHRICSKHFSDESFINIGHKWRRLKITAVPSLHLRKEEFISTDTNSGATFSSGVASTSGAASTSGTVSVSSAISVTSPSRQRLISRVVQLEQDLERLKKVSRRRLLKINSLQQKTRRLKNKNKNLNLILIEFLEKEKNKKENMLLLDCVKVESVL